MVIETETKTMTDEQKQLASFQHLISVMQRDAAVILEAVNQAAEAINEGGRFSAIGSLSMLDMHLERLAALKTAVMLTHRIEPM
jgi:hypothetical protein